jgi:hypothetical protein
LAATTLPVLVRYAVSGNLERQASWSDYSRFWFPCSLQGLLRVQITVSVHARYIGRLSVSAQTLLINSVIGLHVGGVTDTWYMGG